MVFMDNRSSTETIQETKLDSRRIHPELREQFEATPPSTFTLEGLPRLRGMMNSMMAGFGPVSDPDVLITNRTVPGAPGDPEVKVRIYEPREKKEALPGILYIHGGGYIVGDPEMTDGSCARLAKEVGCVVVSVDYRLAPETAYPGPLEDCYAALKWMADNAVELGVDTERLAVTGGSAGGGLTAGLALLARDRGYPKLAFQAPLYPMIDDRNITPSSYEFTDRRLWNREKNEFGWKAYLGDLYGSDDVPIYAAPARAQDLSGLPPTYTFVGELDLFRDETTDYVTRLSQAGVTVEYHIYPGCTHGFDMNPMISVGRRAEADYVRAMTEALAK
jgi:acetyl esterase/lipase